MTGRLPDGLTRIDMNVFNRCSALTEVTIPASVTEVRGFSFMGCTALTDVYYTGTQAQWDAVRIDTSYGDPFKNAAYETSGGNQNERIRTEIWL